MSDNTERGWRLMNTNDGWQIARLSLPGYVASEYRGNPQAADAMHDLYADATRGALLVPDMLNALRIASATITRLDSNAKAPSAQGTLDVIRAAIAKAEGKA